MKYLVIGLVLLLLTVGGAAMAGPPSANASASVSLTVAEFVAISYPGSGYTFTPAAGSTGTTNSTQNFTVTANVASTLSVTTATLTGPDTGVNKPTIATSFPSGSAVAAGTSAASVGVEVSVTVPSQATLAGSYSGTVTVQIAANS